MSSTPATSTSTVNAVVASNPILGNSADTVGFYGDDGVVRAAAIANATDAATAITQLNLVLAALRAVNLIAS